MVVFRCSDIGLDCPYEVASEEGHDLSARILDHIHSYHNQEACSPDVLLKITNALYS